jgi:hypothetical protein
LSGHTAEKIGHTDLFTLAKVANKKNSARCEQQNCPEGTKKGLDSGNKRAANIGVSSEQEWDNACF